MPIVVQLCFTFSRLRCAVYLMSENRPDRLWLDVRHVPPIGVGPCAVPWESCTGVGGRIHGHSNIQPFNSHPHPSHPRKKVFHSVYAWWIGPPKILGLESPAMKNDIKYIVRRGINQCNPCLVKRKKERDRVYQCSGPGINQWSGSAVGDIQTRTVRKVKLYVCTYSVHEYPVLWVMMIYTIISNYLIMFAFCSESYVIIQAGYSFTTHTYILRIYKNNTPYHYFAPGETPVGFASKFGVGLDRFPHAVFFGLIQPQDYYSCLWISRVG